MLQYRPMIIESGKVPGLKELPRDEKTNRLRIDAHSLLRDNLSDWANEARSIWLKTRDEKNLTLVEICGDSRTVLPNPDTSIAINYIAVGEAPPRPQRSLLESPGVGRAVVVGHFDGETARPRKMPRGCGGLAAKENQTTSSELVSNLDYYIRSNINHPDPIIQALITARSMFAHTDKPILVAAQDHRTGKIYPIGVYVTYRDETRGPVFDQGALIARKSVLVCMDERKYDPEVIYETGIPALENHEVPQFSQFLNDADETERRLNDKFPNLYERSKIQDPLLIDFSTSSMPFATCFPETGEEPGLVFEVFGPRERLENGKIAWKPEELIASLPQIDYPISESLVNHGKRNKPFASTNTIRIDTENLETSKELAQRLVAESSVVRQWISISGHKIIISQTSDRVLQGILPFRPNI